MKRNLCLSLTIAWMSASVLWGQSKEAPKPFTNDVGLSFVSIPPGTFVMGSPTDEAGRRKDEIPHKVTLTKRFYMGVNAVTRSQWNAVMNPGVEWPKAERNLPMETVSWDDCQDFIKKLCVRDGKPYRLPTEAEWEYACRAGTTTAYFCGNLLTSKQANFGKGKKGQSKLATMPVGSFPANPWGLHDMHGNVWQWCEDWYGEYSTGDVVDPQGPKNGKERVLRGGSFTELASQCRSAIRHSFDPKGRDPIVGFRVCFFAE